MKISDQLNSVPAPDEQAGTQPTKGRSVALWASRITGFRYAKRNASMVANRAAFPLLRRIIRDEAAVQRSHIAVKDLNDKYLLMTVRWQLPLTIFFGLLSLWSLLVVTRGLAAGIRYDFWFNNWLIIGIPLLVLSLVRTLVSYKTYSICREERHLRQRRLIPTKQNKGNAV